MQKIKHMEEVKGNLIYIQGYMYSSFFDGIRGSNESIMIL